MLPVMKSSLQKTEPMSSAKEYERKISKVVNDTAAQQHITEQAFTYEELRTAANLYAAGLITSRPNAKANKVSLVQSNSSKYPQLLTVKIRCISSTVSLTGCFVP